MRSMKAVKTKTNRGDENSDPFKVAKGVLKPGVDLYWEYLEAFDAACQRLLESRQQRLVVDLTLVNFISSSFVGCLGNLMLQALRRKKRVTLRLTEDISWLFEIMGGQGGIMDVEII